MASGSSSKKKRLLSSAEITAGIAEVAQLAKGNRIMLVGGVALHQYGSDRLTSDIDIVAEHSIQTFPAIKSLSFGGYTSETPSGVPVDVILRNDEYKKVFDEALLYARKLPGVPVSVVSLEYAVVMKMIAHRPKDMADLAEIFTMDALDIQKARGLVRRHLGSYAINDFDSMVREAAWRKSQDE